MTRRDTDAFNHAVGGVCAALAAELVEFCRKGLAPYKYPRQVNFVTELPKTATGKIQRFVLRARFGEEPVK